jgi:hypothetical protein
MNRYKQIHQLASMPTSTSPRVTRTYNPIPVDWQLIILIAAVGAKNTNWHDICYIGKNRLGQILFLRCQSLRIGDSTMAKLAAIREASSLASSMGFRSFIIFTAVKGIEAMWMNTKKINWQLTTIFEDLKCIQQTHGLQMHIKTVPHLIISEATLLATQASRQFLNFLQINV